MTQQAESWRRRQRRVLSQFASQSEKTSEQIAVEAGVTYWRYVRWAHGDSDLPAQYLPALAHAYGVKPQKLIDALELAVEPWSLRGALEVAGLPEDEIVRSERETADWSEPDQRDYARQRTRDHDEATSTHERHRSVS